VLIIELSWAISPQSGSGSTVSCGRLFPMDEWRKTMIPRRDVLLGVTAVGVAVVAGAASIQQAAPGAVQRRDKRRPQYQANSPEIQTFYRVNRYPMK
jgi:hypothetical protein